VSSVLSCIVLSYTVDSSVIKIQFFADPVIVNRKSLLNYVLTYKGANHIVYIMYINIKTLLIPLLFYRC
jgi:NADPH-dependent 7-cyano-7-deazaguanine reductase QueF